MEQVMMDYNPSSHMDKNLTNYNNTTREINTPFDYVIQTIAGLIFIYCTPILVFLGSIGNLISLYVFYTSKMRMQSTRIYLSALAFSDTLFLFQLLPPWLSAISLSNFYQRPTYCQLSVYITYVTSNLSAWLVVAFTVERFVGVAYPLRKNIMCTVARAKYIVIALTTCAMLDNSPVIIFASSAGNDCHIDRQYMPHATWFNIADTVISFSLPLGIIVILNIRIMVDVYRVHRERRVLQEQQATDGQRVNRWNRDWVPPPPPPPRAQHRITRMLLIVSTVYVFLNVPAYTVRLLAYANDMGSYEYTGSWAAMTQIALTFSHVNYGINFILYCLTGTNFRRDVRRALPCLRNGPPPRRPNAMQMTSRNARVNSIATSCASAPEANHAVVPDLLNNAAIVRRHFSEPAIERWHCEFCRTTYNQPAVEMEDLSCAVPGPSFEI